jgi:hypothetical protein
MRIFYKNSSGLNEITSTVSQYNSNSLQFSYQIGDYFYMLSDTPFNHYFFSVSGLGNSNVSTIILEYYSSSGWKEVVNKADYTELFSKSGVTEFTPDRSYPWMMSSTNHGGQQIPGLTDVVVYDTYAFRISFQNNLSNNVRLNYIGSIFSDDIDLYSEFPLFRDTEFLEAFQAGKSNWEEQHVRAGEIIIRDLKKKRVVYSSGQILERILFRDASIQKTAEIIFGSFGNDYTEQALRARKEYDARMSLEFFQTDTNNNGIKDGFENAVSSGWLSR